MSRQSQGRVPLDPAHELGVRHEHEPAATDDPNITHDVPLERVDGHCELRRGFYLCVREPIAHGANRLDGEGASDFRARARGHPV